MLGLDWLRDIFWTIRNIESTMMLTDQSEKYKLITNFEKQFKTNRTNKDSEIKLQLNTGHPLIKQKAKPTPYQLRSYVE